MPNLTDKDIDRLSRAAAEFHEPDDAGLSWSKFEQQFRQQLPDKPPGRWSAGRLRPYAWGSAILAITGLTYFLTKNNSHTTNSTLTIGKQSIAAVQRSPNGQTKTFPTGTITLDSTGVKDNKRPMDLPGSIATIPGKVASASKNNETRASAGQESTPSAGTLQKDHARVFLKKSLQQLRQHRGGHSLHLSSDGRDESNVSADHPAENGAYTDANKPAAGDRFATMASLPERQGNHSGLHPILRNDSLLNRFPPIAHSSTVAGKHLNINRALVIGFAAGPDYTNGGGVTNDQLSDNIGITLGYYLTSRLSVNTGLIYTKKYYWTKGDGFRILGWPGTYFPVEFVNGNCNMWEIPLTVRYDFPAGSKTNFFINGGLSSYLMTKEDYTLFYHNGNRIYGKEFESDQHHNYLFSVLNLSAGFEREIGKGFSFQAEPFLKLPTHGIGLGNTKMNSYGLLFSFRYAPALKKSRR